MSIANMYTTHTQKNKAIILEKRIVNMLIENKVQCCVNYYIFFFYICRTKKSVDLYKHVRIKINI